MPRPERPHRPKRDRNVAGRDTRAFERPGPHKPVDRPAREFAPPIRRDVPADRSESKGYVVGRRAALELLHDDEGRRKIEKIYLAHGVQGPQIGEILTVMRKHRIANTELDRRKFRELELRVADNTDSQGVIVLTALRSYQTVDEVLHAMPAGTQPLFVALDGVEDPHNIGAILRSAEAAGVHAVLLHQMKAALTPAVYKTSAGAAEHIPIIKYGNLDQTIRSLREDHGFSVFGLAGEGEHTIYETDLTKPVILVTGSEEKGLHHLIRQRCDALVKIPLTGKTQSLNASVATAVALFEAIRQRSLKE